jgi:hypothetical protein
MDLLTSLVALLAPLVAAEQQHRIGRYLLSLLLACPARHSAHAYAGVPGGQGSAGRSTCHLECPMNTCTCTQHSLSTCTAP